MIRPFFFGLVSLCLLAPQLQAETLELREILIVGKSKSGTSWSNKPLETTIDDLGEMAVIGIAKEGKKTIYLADKDISPLFIQKKEISSTLIKPWSDVGDVEVRWSYVEPNAWRTDEKNPDGSVIYYTNVVEDGPKIGKWVGYDEITYFETEASPWSKQDNARKHAATANPPRQEDDKFGGLGTIRYRADLRLPDGKVFSTPGAEAHDIYGMLPSVFRVSVRKDNTYFGYMTSYFMVPRVFGSAGGGKNNQTDRYVGADCADVLVGGLRAKGVKIKYSFVAGLPDHADSIEKPHFIDENGKADGEPMSKAKVGDLIRINYSGRPNDKSPKSWDHVGLWYEDKSDPEGPFQGGPDGIFDGFDLVMHMGHPYLTIAPFKDQAPATVDVLRWKKSLKI